MNFRGCAAISTPTPSSPSKKYVPLPWWLIPCAKLVGLRCGLKSAKRAWLVTLVLVIADYRYPSRYGRFADF
jgi:hypothetical protein